MVSVRRDVILVLLNALNIRSILQSFVALCSILTNVVCLIVFVLFYLFKDRVAVMLRCSDSIRKSSAACSPGAHIHSPVIRDI